MTANLFVETFNNNDDSESKIYCLDSVPNKFVYFLHSQT